MHFLSIKSWLLLIFATQEIFAKLPSDLSKRLDDYWFKYKSLFNKTYTGKCEETHRSAWEDNIIKIYEHNLLAEAGHYNYTLRDNHISDLSPREYLKELAKLWPSHKRRVCDDQMVAAILHNSRTIPPRLDWREQGFLTRPENQRDCGSCYAYSIAGSIAGQIFKQTGRLISLSEQQIVDCSVSTGNYGCRGGSLRNTLQYLERAGGLMLSANYPYRSQQGVCRFNKRLSVVNITSWAILPARDERALEAAVATIGPIAVSINASPRTFQLYHRGIYDDFTCTSNVVNHAMLLVGYSPHYWILKNWWGAEWGEGGYMRLIKGKNRCGVANYAAYAKV